MTDDDSKRDDEAPEEADPAADEHAGEHEVPPPATYAGRRRAEAGKDPDPEEAAESEELRAGFTEEFDDIERELDQELAGLGEPPPEAEEPVEVEPAAESEEPAGETTSEEAAEAQAPPSEP